MSADASAFPLAPDPYPGADAPATWTHSYEPPAPPAARSPLALAPCPYDLEPALKLAPDPYGPVAPLAPDPYIEARPIRSAQRLTLTLQELSHRSAVRPDPPLALAPSPYEIEPPLELAPDPYR